MYLSNEIKQKIEEEYNDFKKHLYAGKSLEERKELDQFFTPPELTIKMIEMFDCDSLSDKTILDPCCGSGNLLVGCYFAGALPKNLYGNDYDKIMVETCRKRLKNLFNKDGYRFESFHIHQGNTLQKICLTKFDREYEELYNPDYINDLNYAQKDLKIFKTEELW